MENNAWQMGTHLLIYASAWGAAGAGAEGGKKVGKTWKSSWQTEGSVIEFSGSSQGGRTKETASEKSQKTLKKGLDKWMKLW